MSTLHCIFAVGSDISILRAPIAAASSSFMSPLNPPNPCLLLFLNSGGQRSCFQEKSAAFSSLSQRSRFYLPKNFMSLI